jgi:rRNA maturation RNase YbeY
MDKVCRKNRSKGWSRVSVVLTDDALIRTINQQHFNKHTVTDVISIRYEPIPGEEPFYSGEIFVNVECVLKRKPARWTASKELALYLAHGCDHLSGACDKTEKDRKRMRLRELRWLKDASALDLVEGLIDT